VEKTRGRMFVGCGKCDQMMENGGVFLGWGKWRENAGKWKIDVWLK